VFSEIKAREKPDYMHNNPVKAGLVDNPVDWPYSSARWYLLRKAVGVDIKAIL
jgi:putative transposase